MLKKKYLTVVFVCLISAVCFAKEQEQNSRITDEVIPLQFDLVPDRPAPILELGHPFLDTGPIGQGFTLPTGAVWQPAFMVWGDYRTAFQGFYDGQDHVKEWSNRFDLYGNLYLTPTERILAGVRFLDEDGRFTGYTFNAPESVRSGGEGYDEHLNPDVTTLFFEGDFGELFPFLDQEEKFGLDFSLAVGRQPISFQDGILVNDSLDAVGISKINLKSKKFVNMRSTFLWANNEVNRTNLVDDDRDSTLYGWFNEIDFRHNTLELDAVFVESSDTIGDGYYLGLGSTQRLGKINNTFRILGSIPEGEETDHNSAGMLLFNEISWTIKGKEDYVYANAFVGIDHFRSASRGPTDGGPASQTGILFEDVGLGRYASALSNTADETFGGALGYQMFLDHTRKQIIFELGGRYSDESTEQRAMGLGMRYQAALGQRTVIRIDGYGVYDQERDALAIDRSEARYGARFETLIRF